MCAQFYDLTQHFVAGNVRHIGTDPCDDWVDKLISFLRESENIISHILTVETPKFLFPAKAMPPNAPVIPYAAQQVTFALAKGYKDGPMNIALTNYTPYGPYVKYLSNHDRFIIGKLNELKQGVGIARAQSESENKVVSEIKAENEKLLSKVKKYKDRLRVNDELLDMEMERLRGTQEMYKRMYETKLKELETRLDKAISVEKEMTLENANLLEFIHDNIRRQSEDDFKMLEDDVATYFRINLGDDKISRKYFKIIKIISEHIKQLMSGLDIHLLATYERQPQEIKETIELVLELYKTERAETMKFTAILNKFRKLTDFPLAVLEDMLNKHNDINTIVNEMLGQLNKGTIYYKKTETETILFGATRDIMEQMEQLKEQIRFLQQSMKQCVDKYNLKRKKLREKVMKQVLEMSTNILSKNNILKYVKHKYYRRKAVLNCLTKKEKNSPYPKRFLGIRINPYIIFLLERKCLSDVLKININKLDDTRFKYIVKALTQLNKTGNYRRALIWFRNHYAKQRGLNQAGPKNKDHVVQETRFYNTYVVGTDTSLRDFLNMETHLRLQKFYKFYKQLDREVNANYIARHFSNDLKNTINRNSARDMSQTIKSHQFNLLLPESHVFDIRKPRVNVLAATQRMKKMLMERTYKDSSGRSELVATMNAIETTLLKRYRHRINFEKANRDVPALPVEGARKIYVEYERMISQTEIDPTDDNDTIKCKIEERAAWIQEFQERMKKTVKTVGNEKEEESDDITYVVSSDDDFDDFDGYY